MSVASEGRAGDGRAAFMPVSPAVLPFVLCRPDDDASVLTQADRPDAP